MGWYRGVPWCPVRSSRHSQGVQPVPKRNDCHCSVLQVHGRAAGCQHLRHRLQIEASKPEAEQIYSGMQDCFQKILKDEGAKGFFKGALANILRGTGAAIVLVLYDEIMNFVERSA